MDLSVLRTVLFGALSGLEGAALTVAGNVFSSAFSIVSAAQAAAHGGVAAVISLARATLRAAERVTTEVVLFTFSVANAAVIAAVGVQPIRTSKVDTEEAQADAQI